jgi:hypothetical protein
LQSSGIEPGFIERNLERVTQFLAAGNTTDLATCIMNQPGFGDWENLSQAQKVELVENAVVEAAIPGLRVEWDDPFRELFAKAVEAVKSGKTLRTVSGEALFDTAWSSAMTGPRAIWALVFSDLPNTIIGVLGEMPPPIGIAAEKLFEQSDEVVNGLAIRYYLIGLVYPEIYNWIVDAIDRQGGPAIAAVKAVQAPAEPETFPSGGVMPQPLVPALSPAPEVLPAPQAGLPSPPTVLAVGYAAMAAGAVLGIFK